MIDHLDHIVLTRVDPKATTFFFTQIESGQLESFQGGRVAFHFGNQKINLHVHGREFKPKARLPALGALDLCFIASIPRDEVVKHLNEAGLFLKGQLSVQGQPIKFVWSISVTRL